MRFFIQEKQLLCTVTTFLDDHLIKKIITIMTHIADKLPVQTSATEKQLINEESALSRTTIATCVECPHFQDFHEPNGRGWCNLFDRMAKQHHPRTHDCDSTLSLYPENLELPEEDLPHSEFDSESIVKVIDSEEHHSEWATFIVVGKKLNTERYRTTESYLSQPQWYYELAAILYKPTFEPFWVAETDICHFDQSHLIETSSDVF